MMILILPLKTCPFVYFRFILAQNFQPYFYLIPRNHYNFVLIIVALMLVLIVIFETRLKSCCWSFAQYFSTIV